MTAYEIDRRGFLTKTGVAAVSIGLAGCSGDGSSDSPDTSGESTTMYMAAGGEAVDDGPVDDYVGEVVFERDGGGYGISVHGLDPEAGTTNVGVGANGVGQEQGFYLAFEEGEHDFGEFYERSDEVVPIEPDESHEQNLKGLPAFSIDEVYDEAVELTWYGDLGEHQTLDPLDI